MANYKIITDEKLLREFITWLPELESHEKYYLSLYGRSKYCKTETGENTITQDKSQLARFTSDKDRMFNKIKQLEVEYGAYIQRDKIIPQEALALYITINPRDMYKASINTMVKLAKGIRDNNLILNPHQEAMSEIQKSKSRTCYVTFDLDYQGDYPDYNSDLIRDIQILTGNKKCFKIIETRGGYHILVQSSLVSTDKIKTFYQAISKLEHIDQTGDLMSPVPGSWQGSFTPHFIN